MPGSTREEIVEVFDACDGARDRQCELSFEALTTPELLRVLDRMERDERRSRTVRHAVINQLAAQATKEELGGTLPAALAERLRITKAEAGRRVAEAFDLGPRRALTGEILAPLLTATAAAQAAGLIGDSHIRVIRSFFAHLPVAVDSGTREAAENDLACKSRDYRPEQVAKYAQQIMNLLHPDGDYSDQDRARKRGIVLGKQEFDGMTRISGLITPELRATIEAVWAKLTAPATGKPDRSQAQRQHDGLLTSLHNLLGSETLGQHNGLPVTIVVTTTLKELEAATGRAVTAGGTLVPMSDVIRWAGSAHHYLALFDGCKPLALYHTKRFASVAQRIMLYAKERGCSRPGCDAPAYHTQVHHVTGWTNTHSTDIDDLTLACGPDNRLAENGWTTRTNAHGETEWLPPAHLDHGQPRINTFHHPEKMLAPEDDDEPD